MGHHDDYCVSPQRDRRYDRSGRRYSPEPRRRGRSRGRYHRSPSRHRYRSPTPYSCSPRRNYSRGRHSYRSPSRHRDQRPRSYSSPRPRNVHIEHNHYHRAPLSPPRKPDYDYPYDRHSPPPYSRHPPSPYYPEEAHPPRPGPYPDPYPGPYPEYNPPPLLPPPPPPSEFDGLCPHQKAAVGEYIESRSTFQRSAAVARTQPDKVQSEKWVKHYERKINDMKRLKKDGACSEMNGKVCPGWDDSAYAQPPIGRDLKEETRVMVGLPRFVGRY